MRERSEVVETPKVREGGTQKMTWTWNLVSMTDFVRVEKARYFVLYYDNSDELWLESLMSAGTRKITWL